MKTIIIDSFQLMLMNVVLGVLFICLCLWWIIARKELVLNWLKQQKERCQKFIIEHVQTGLAVSLVIGMLVLNLANPLMELYTVVKEAWNHETPEYRAVTIAGSCLLFGGVLYVFAQLFIWISNYIMATATGSKDDKTAEEHGPAKAAVNVTIDQGSLGLQFKTIDSLKAKMEQQRNELEALKVHIGREIESSATSMTQKMNELAQKIDQLSQKVPIAETAVATVAVAAEVQSSVIQPDKESEVESQQGEEEQPITVEVIKDIVSSVLQVAGVLKFGEKFQLNSEQKAQATVIETKAAAQKQPETVSQLQHQQKTVRFSDKPHFVAVDHDSDSGSSCFNTDDEEEFQMAAAYPALTKTVKPRRSIVPQDPLGKEIYKQSAEIKSLRKQRKEEKRQQSVLSSEEQGLTRDQLITKLAKEAQVKRLGEIQDRPLTEEEKGMSKAQLRRVWAAENSAIWVERQKERGYKVVQCGICGKYDREGENTHLCYRTGMESRKGQQQQEVVVKTSNRGVKVTNAQIVDEKDWEKALDNLKRIAKQKFGTGDELQEFEVALNEMKVMGKGEFIVEDDVAMKGNDKTNSFRIAGGDTPPT